jgi:hypothetical protein
MKADTQATAERNFQDERSYVAGERMHPGTEHPCQYLAGDDVGPFREAIYKRDGGRCQLRLTCDGEAVLPLDGSIWERWHLEHEQGGIGQSRCWCPENVRGACYACHQVKDGRQPRWTKR